MATIDPEFAPRFLNFVGATGKVEKKERDGRQYTVVPVIALVEGAIRAMNAKDYEYVSAECFSAAPHEWDGMPLQPGHPMVDGVPVSASLPEFKTLAFGHIEQTQAKGKQLRTMAWIDDERAKSNEKSARVLQRINDGKMVEVSVGAYVSIRSAQGESNGRKYAVAWAKMKPDHLAMLADHQIGACSIEMGCGALRVNQLHDDTFTELEGEEQIRTAYSPDQPRDENGQWTDTGSGHLSYDAVHGPIQLIKSEHLAKIVSGHVDLNKKAGHELASRGLNQRGKWVGFDKAREIHGHDPEDFGENGNPDATKEAARGVLQVMRPDTLAAVARGEVDLNDVAQQQLAGRGLDKNNRWIGFTSPFMPTPRKRRNLQAVQDDVPVELKAACGCGGNKPVIAASAAGEHTMKEARIAALIANPHNPVKELKALEALTDDGLKALEDAASAGKKAADDLRTAQETAVETSTDLTALQTSFKTLQDSAQPLIDADNARKTAEKTALVASLKAAQTVMSEEQLNAETIERLRTLAAIAKIAPAAAPAVDFSGMGMPRVAQSPDDFTMFAPPDPWAALSRTKQ